MDAPTLRLPDRSFQMNVGIAIIAHGDEGAPGTSPATCARILGVTRVLDPEGAHIAALRRLADFRGQRVLEMGCGDGRLTAGIAADGASVFAFDPDAESVSAARRSLPGKLAERVVFRAASAQEIEIERAAFDLVVFSWSL
jgi:2-polyprenyl-3-methyl-5-hydroxy-6-metoxy-1,4-benzoquinol methylase